MPSDWIDALLGTLGAPTTKSNRDLLGAWQRYEGGHTNNTASYNWLNTTLDKSYPAINSVGVRAYPDFNTGITKTADTLLGGYPTIVSLLRQGQGSRVVADPAGMGDLNYWLSGKRVQQATPYVRKIAGALGVAPATGGPTLESGAPTTTPTPPTAQPSTENNGSTLALLSLLMGDSRITPFDELLRGRYA